MRRWPRVLGDRRTESAPTEFAEFAGPLAAALAQIPSATYGFGPLLEPAVAELAGESVGRHWQAAGLDPRGGRLYGSLYPDPCPPAFRSPRSVAHSRSDRSPPKWSRPNRNRLGSRSYRPFPPCSSPSGPCPIATSRCSNNSDRRLAAGAGCRLLDAEITAEAVASKVAFLLEDDDCRNAAALIADEIAAMPAPATAVSALENLSREPHHAPPHRPGRRPRADGRVADRARCEPHARLILGSHAGPHARLRTRTENLIITREG